MNIKERFKEFLGEDGINFFTEIYDEHGKLNVCLTDGDIPYPVHFRAGMQVRNWMRGQEEYKNLLEKEQAGEEQFDDIWEGFVIDALELKND